jgi:hypothetical protein
MHVADELLRNRARSATVFAEYPAFDSAGNADDVNAVVLVKALVFNSDKCLRHVPWKRAD